MMVSLNEVMKKFYPMSSGNVHYNCAEASLRSINEYYDYNSQKKHIRL